MQCGCPQCGILMSLSNKGVQSECTCPNCFYACSACLGTKSVMTKEQLAMHAMSLSFLQEDDQYE